MTQVPDLAILGGGSAGYATALRAAQLGLDVTLVEEDELGGTCLHRGCVPTKAWLQAAKTRATVAKADRLGIGAILTGVDLAKVRGFADSLVSGLHRGLTGLIRSRGIQVVRGRGRLMVDSGGPGLAVGGELLRARNVVLATGAVPITLGLPTDGERILTSEHALRLERLPERAVILGGGVIGASGGASAAAVGRCDGAQVSRLVKTIQPAITGRRNHAPKTRTACHCSRKATVPG